MSDFEPLLAALDEMLRYKEDGAQAPHKPVVVLDALAQLQHGNRQLSFVDCEARLGPIIRKHWHPARPARVEHPFWRLKSEAFWHLGFPEGAALTGNGTLSAAKLRAMDARAGFSQPVIQMLLERPARIVWAARVLLPELRQSETQVAVVKALSLKL